MTDVLLGVLMCLSLVAPIFRRLSTDRERTHPRSGLYKTACFLAVVLVTAGLLVREVMLAMADPDFDGFLLLAAGTATLAAVLSGVHSGISTLVAFRPNSSALKNVRITAFCMQWLFFGITLVCLVYGRGKILVEKYLHQ
jgi:hypothetical protein